ncbi:8586_t:CDS:2 [Diversispora eburnea]|uniref:8586_t:CDS:1 n=1 Tax=Diversispora eburnea TaxID=1213867 RepID=A0A9N8V0L7_9GLOM|nr:8586_t:CDS:2 [Diversispora eburnea]
MGCISSKKLDDDNGSRKVEIRIINVDEAHKAIPDNNSDISEKYPMTSIKYYGNDRFKLHHNLYRYIWQSNFSSPVEERLSLPDVKVLDVGCGPGTWILELAKEYPNASFTGIDHRTLFKAEPPSNVTIEYNDLLTTLPFNDNSFDFVFMRFLAYEITEERFEKNVIPELVRVLKPNGYLEIMDIDVHGGNEGPVAQQLTSAGINSNITQKIKKFMNSTNIVDVQSLEQFHPIGSWDYSWDKEIGEAALKDWELRLNNLKINIEQILGINEEEFRDLIKSFEAEVDIFQTYWISRRIFGKKKIDEK